MSDWLWTEAEEMTCVACSKPQYACDCVECQCMPVECMPLDDHCENCGGEL